MNPFPPPPNDAPQAAGPLVAKPLDPTLDRAPRETPTILVNLWMFVAAIVQGSALAATLMVVASIYGTQLGDRRSQLPLGESQTFVAVLAMVCAAFATGLVRAHFQALREDSRHESPSGFRIAILLMTATGLAAIWCASVGCIVWGVRVCLGWILLHGTPLESGMSLAIVEWLTWLVGGIVAAMLGWLLLIWTDATEPQEPQMPFASREEFAGTGRLATIAVMLLLIVLVAVAAVAPSGWQVAAVVGVLVTAAGVRTHIALADSQRPVAATRSSEIIFLFLDSLLRLFAVIALCISAACPIGIFIPSVSPSPPFQTVLSSSACGAMVLWAGVWASWVFLRLPAPSIPMKARIDIIKVRGLDRTLGEPSTDATEPPSP